MKIKNLLFTLCIFLLVGNISFSQNTYVPDDNFEQALIDLGYDSGELNDSVPTVNIEPILELDLNNKNINDLTGIEGFTSLENLNCNTNNITSVDLTANSDLIEVSFNYNQLTEFDVSNNLNLTSVSCNANQLTTLDLSQNKLLVYIYCAGNNLTSLNLDSNLVLQELWCLINDIEELDVSKNIELTFLWCEQNKLTTLNLKNGNNADMWVDASDNPNLFCIEVDNPALSNNYSNWSKDDHASYSLNCITHMTYIPDDNFEQALIDLGFDSGELNDSVPTRAIDTIQVINVSNRNIHDLTGIENFASLKTLACSNNFIGKLNLEILSITYLDCSNNQLTYINLNFNTSLEEFNCSTNNLSELDLSINSKLSVLNASNNNLSYVDLVNGNNHKMFVNLRNNPNLFCIAVDDPTATEGYTNWSIDEQAGYSTDCGIQMAYIPDNNFEQALIDLGYDSGELNDSVPTNAIDTVAYLKITSQNIFDLTGIENFSNLLKLECDSNNISELDLSNNLMLEELYCWENELTELDLSNNQELTRLICAYNNLSSLNLCYNINLTFINCRNNQLTEIDVSNCSELRYLHCADNQITNLDIYHHTNLYTFHGEGNQLINLNLQNGNNHNMYVDIRDNPNLTCVEVDDPYSSYEYGNWYKDPFTGYSTNCSSYKQEMTYVPDDNFEQYLINNGYDNGDLNDSVPTCAIRTINSVIIYDSNISDVTGIEDFQSLSVFNANNTNIKILDLSNNLNLFSVYCYPELEYLNIQNSSNWQLSTLRVENNPNLYCIQVDWPLTQNYIHWYKDAQASYSDNCGPAGSGVPISEYNSLVDLYYSTNGEEWTDNTNWLDTTEYSVADWYGVTVENGHVTQVLLNDNNLQNSAFEENILLPNLRRLEMRDNKLTGFNFNATDLLVNLDTLMLINNQLIFEDLIPAFSVSNYSNFSDDFFYAPQQKVDTTEYADLFVGENFTFEVEKEFLSANDQFQWCKELIPIEGETNFFIELSPVSKSDSGTYHLEITNPAVPNLVIYSNYKTTYVLEPKGAGIPVSEYNALKDFYTSTNGDNWTNSTNWLDTVNYTVNDWFGITVENGHVTQINFDAYNNYNLNGSIPNSIKDLTQLEILQIVTDELSGEIPDGFYELTNLRDISIAECKLSGGISSEIGNLTNLERIAFEANQLEGPIPDEIGNLQKLRHLSLMENNFIGEIPYSIGNLINLEYLGLSNNNLSGTIPESIGNLVNLGWLLVDGNQITGPLPKELANLMNAFKINIRNNQFGLLESSLNSYYTKSLSVENNRQIPDELADLLEMDTLYLGGNKLQFNDIEAIFSWDNYNNFNDFIYSPQDSIGISKTISKGITENIIVTIDNYFAGPSDKYQWYKNGTLLIGKTEATLELTNLQLSDAGKYNCKITNPVAGDLILFSKNTTLNISESTAGAGIPISEYNALKEFYNTLDGDNWENNTNWLDTTTVSVEDWFGITILNGHVTKIKLTSNNLTGTLPEALTGLTELLTLRLDSNNISGTIPTWIDDLYNLEHLNLSKNQLSGEITSDIGKMFDLETINFSNNLLEGEIPLRMINLPDITQFYIDSNLYTSVNIEPVFDWSSFNLFEDGFVYSPQYDVGRNDSVTVSWGDELTIEIPDYTPGTADVFQWFKDSVLLPAETEKQIFISQADSSAAGTYYCIITNTIATELSVSSKPFNVKIEGTISGAGVPVSEYLTLVEIYNNANGPEWISSENWLDTTFHSIDEWFGILVEDGHVTGFEMPNNNLSKIPEELNKLTELKVIDLSSGNFEGEVPKLDSLVNLSSISLTNNKLTFKDLTPVTKWDNYNSFKSDFNYNPQPGVGEADTLEYILGDTMILNIQNYNADENDNFEWFRNGISLQSGAEKTFTKTAWMDDNEANFHCEITNSLLPDLTLTSATILTKVFYNSTDSTFLEQLRTTFAPLQEIWTGDSVYNWSGVTFENGKITKLDLSGLNLEGDISQFLADFDSLVWLDLSNNNLSGPITTAFETSALKNTIINEESSLLYLNISGNNYIFSDLEPSVDALNSIDEFIYSPQSNIGVPSDTTIYKYQNVTFNIESFNPGLNDEFEWFKNGQAISGDGEVMFSVINAALQDSGIYTCRVTNSLFPDLTLFSETNQLHVLVPVGISEFSDGEILIYPNPANQKVFIDTDNKKVDLKLFDLAGVIILEEKDFTTDWINIQHITPGIYLFNILNKKGEIITRKIVFK